MFDGKEGRGNMKCINILIVNVMGCWGVSGRIRDEDGEGEGVGGWGVGA